jgi:hypothetical protein
MNRNNVYDRKDDTLQQQNKDSRRSVLVWDVTSTKARRRYLLLVFFVLPTKPRRKHDTMTHSILL